MILSQGSWVGMDLGMPRERAVRVGQREALSISREYRAHTPRGTDTQLIRRNEALTFPVAVVEHEAAGAAMHFTRRAE